MLKFDKWCILYLNEREPESDNMSIKSDNEKGSISISNDVIIKTAGISAMQCCGVAGMAVKDSKVHLLKRESFAKGIEIAEDEENRINVKLHVVVNYGNNSAAVGETVYDAVFNRLNEDLGKHLGDVKVIVEGIRKDSEEGRF